MPDAIANRYEVLASLGEGGMGKVLAVKDLVTDRDVALKLVHGRGPGALQQLKHEFWTMTRLRHPHTVEVYDYGQLEDGTPYFTMEVVEGRGLDEMLPMPPAQVRDVMVSLCRALSYIHAQGYVHADLKPENVRLRPDGLLKLMDFGLMERAGRSGGPIRGTLLYLAPEVARGGRVDLRADLYSLGAVAFHLLSGRPPYESASAMALIKCHLEAPIPDLPETEDAELQAIVRRLMAKDPIGRYQSAGDVLEALGQDAEEIGSVLLAPSFAGHEAELERLAALLERPEGGTLALIGPSGAGKTRLAQEFLLMAQLAERASCMICGQERGAPYAPIVETLRSLLPLAKSVCPAVLESHAPVLARLLPDLGEQVADSLEPQQEKLRLQTAIVDVLAAVGRARGLVLIADDAQWLDEASREVLSHLVRNIHQLAIDVVLVGDTPDWKDLQLMELGGLSPDEALGLMQSMLGTSLLASEFTDPVIEVAQGNPRYLVDLLHHLVESGLLIRVDGRWQTEGGFNLAALPRDLQGMLGRKLETLGTEALAIARAVALAGTADLALLALLPDLPQDEALYQALAELEHEGLLEGSEQGYRFVQHQVRSLVSGGVPEAEAQRWHGAIAEALLPRLASSDQDVALLNALADHLLLSEHPARALPYTLQAGERNLDLFANVAAQRYLSEGLKLLDEDDAAMALRYRTALGDAERRRGNFQASAVSLEAAVELAAALGEQDVLARTLGTLGKVRQALGDYDKAKEALHRGSDVAEACGSPRERVRNLTTLGRILYFGGDMEGTIALYQRALEISREAQLPVYLAESLAFLGYLFTSDPARQEDGLAFLQESLTIKHTLGDKFGLNDTTMLLGNAYLAMGRYSEANECFLHCHQLNAEIGQKDEEIFSLLNLAIVAFEMGDLAEALRLGEQATQGSVKSNSLYAEGMSRTLSGIAQLYLGQVGPGTDEVERGLELARQMNNRYLEATIAVYRADMLLQVGRLPEAVSYATEALAMAEEAGVREVVAPLQVLLGMAHLFTGDREASRLALNQARRLAGDSNARGVGAKALWALALLAAHGRDFGTAQRLAHESLQDAQEVGARLLAAQGHALLGELQLAQERRNLATEHLRKAINLAEGIGCPTLHGRVLRLLADAEPLRADSLLKLARNESDRLLFSMPQERRASFEEAWLTPWVASGGSHPQERLSVANRLGRVSADLAELMASAREQEAQSSELKRAHERLEQLVQFALKINQIHDLQLVLEMVMDLILEITRSERGFLLLYDGDDVQICQLRNMRAELGESEWEISRSIADEVLRSEQPICLKDALTDDRFKHSRSVQELQLRTVLCVPLKIRNAVIGALYVDRQSVDEAFSERDLDVVMSLAALATTAIDNAHLHLEWNDKSRKLQMLNDLARTMSNTLVMEEVLDLVVRHTLELTTAERGFVLLWEADELVCRAALSRQGEQLDLSVSTISQTICQKVAESGRALCVADAMADEEFQVQASIMALNLRTVMCVPLIAKQSVLGLLYVDSQAIVRSFSNQELELLEAMASHASVAIENAHLYTDLAHRAQELEHLVQLYEDANLRASTDGLTGLHNRRFFQDQLNRDFSQARRHRRNLSVIMVDIDHFKSFNDTYGHGLGDQVLVAVSTVLGQAVRLADVVARYGGEEFIVALPDTPLDGAQIVAERIRRSVSEIGLTDDEGNALRQITVSVGVSTLHLEDERIAELVERADRALYMSKVKGRNQVQTIEE